ncbi:MAG: RDD family protein [Acidobacteriia bacterium]|nr:RDD family protein [Terriglobia bacterium]
MSVLGLSIIDTKPTIEGAGFWIRVLARIVDYAYGYVVGFFAGVFGAIALAILQVLSIAEPGWQIRISQGKVLMVVMSLVGGICYHTICEGMYGASLGKLVCGLRVLSEDCSPCRLKPALIRSLAYFIDGLVFGAVGYLEMTKTRMEQRHGDHWAKTVVVRNPQVPEGSKRSGLRFLLAIFLGSAVWSLPLIAAIVGLGLDA